MIVNSLNLKGVIVCLISFFSIFTQAESAQILPVNEPFYMGNWQFDSYFYQGQENPIPNPQLVLQFEFFSDKTNRLFWVRKNETGFCERRAHFSYEAPYIEQEVFWTNPANSMECGQDTDMQVGNFSRAKLIQVGEKLHLYIDFSGEDFIYIFKRIR